MKVKVYFSQNSSLWDQAHLDSSLSGLPLSIRAKIEPYKNPIDKQSRITGKLLLLKMIEDMGLDLALSDLHYTEHNKPYFESLVLKHPLGGLPAGRQGVGGNLHFDFSIAHAGDMVVCAGVIGARIGVDIEPLTEINVADYRSELTTSEWYIINHNQNPSAAFLQIWTKKEALLKATGRGIAMDMSYIDACSDLITVHREQFSLFKIPLHSAFISHIAVTGGHAEIEIRECDQSES